MSTAEIDTTGDILALVPEKPSEVLNPEAFEAFYAKVKGVLDAHVVDVTTAKGRAAVKSLAYKVAQCKAPIDKAALALTEVYRQKTAEVNEMRKEVKIRLGELEDTFRKPLTDWERSEAERAKTVSAFFVEIKNARVILATDTSHEVLHRADIIVSMVIDSQIFGDRFAEAIAARGDLHEFLLASAERMRKEETDRAELQSLRDALAAKEEAERQRLADEEKAARIKAMAEAQEAKRKADAEALEARRAAEVERAAADAARAETARLQKLEADRLAAVQAEAEATAKRNANTAHREGVLREVCNGMMDAGIGEGQAKALITAILAGEIPSLKIEF